MTKLHYVDIMEYCTAIKMNELYVYISWIDLKKHNADQIKTKCQKIQYNTIQIILKVLKQCPILSVDI